MSRWIHDGREGLKQRWRWADVDGRTRCARAPPTALCVCAPATQGHCPGDRRGAAAGDPVRVDSGRGVPALRGGGPAAADAAVRRGMAPGGRAARLQSRGWPGPGRRVRCKRRCGGTTRASTRRPVSPVSLGPSRRDARSTRRRTDAEDLPRMPVEDRTLGRTFTASDGTTYRPRRPHRRDGACPEALHTAHYDATARRPCETLELNGEMGPPPAYLCTHRSERGRFQGPTSGTTPDHAEPGAVLR